MPISEYKVRGEENVNNECENFIAKEKLGNLKGGE